MKKQWPITDHNCGVEIHEIRTTLLLLRIRAPLLVLNGDLWAISAKPCPTG